MHINTHRCSNISARVKTCYMDLYGLWSSILGILSLEGLYANPHGWPSLRAPSRVEEQSPSFQRPWSRHCLRIASWFFTVGLTGTVQQGASKMDTMTCEKYVFCIGCSAERFQRVIQLPSGIASGWLDTMQDVWLHWCLMVLHHGREYRDYTVQSRSSVSCVS